MREAARRQAEGFDIETLTDWAIQHRDKICHWFTIDSFTHLRHGGRVSVAAAVMGTALNIKPLLHVAADGALQAAEKIRGTKRSMLEQVSRMRVGWMPELGTQVIVGHADCLDKAEELCVMLHEAFPTAQLCITSIGPVIGAHSGPGTLAVFYWGNNK